LNLGIRICLEFSALSLGFDLGIAELVPNEMRNLLLRVCFGYASQPLPLLAMTRGSVPRNDKRGDMPRNDKDVWRCSARL